MAEHVKSGVIARIAAKELENEPVALQIFLLEALNNKKFKCRFTDGSQVMDGILSSQVSGMVTEGLIEELSIVKVLDYTHNRLATGEKLIATSCEVLGKCERQLGATAGVKEEAAKTPAVKREAAPAERTPFVQKMNAFNTPGPTPPFSEETKKTPGSQLQRTPGLLLGSARKGMQPIAALNPYNTNWTIKARVVSKAPKRSFKGKGGETTSVFSIELVDEQGTQIEATLWRELADQHYDSLAEGKVYFFSRGKVKPADKRYSAVRNEYQINFDSGSAIEESEDQDVGKMQAKLNIVPIDQLPSFVGKKMLVDVMGVVTQINALSSVKRKADNQELQRRDVTLLDQSSKTVSLTMWGKLAEEQGAALEGLSAPVVTVSACRVSDFNGVSVSSVTRSSLHVNPEDEAAQALRQWYDSIGHSSATSHVGDGLANANTGSGKSRERATIASIQKAPEDLPSADAKPEWHTLTCTVSLVDPAQTPLYYAACAENNRKVVEKDGAYLCEYDGKVYSSMTRRYVLLAKVTDCTGEVTVNLFNNEAEALLGLSADELAVFKEGSDTQRYEAALKRVQWTEWLANIKASTREYNGTQRQQFAVASLKPIDYVLESRRMITQLVQCK